MSPAAKQRRQSSSHSAGSPCTKELRPKATPPTVPMSQSVLLVEDNEINMKVCNSDYDAPARSRLTDVNPNHSS